MVSSNYLPSELERTPSEQRDVWAYKVDGRWVIGPDRGSRNCWGYSKKTDKPMTEVRPSFFMFDFFH